MTGEQIKIFDGIDGSLFKKQLPLGNYAKVSFIREEKKELHVFFDREAKWVHAFLTEYFKTVPEHMTYEQIFDFLKFTKRKLVRQKWASRFKITQIHVGGAGPGNYYFDEPLSMMNELDFIIILTAKLLFEKFTRIESFIAALDTKEKNLPSWTLVMRMHDQRGVSRIFDSSLQNSSLHLAKFENGLLLGKLRLAADRIKIIPTDVEWTQTKKSLAIYNEFGQALIFQITGRTPAEKRFEKEEDLHQGALPHQLVPIELNFHPFWRPLSHTTLRIGRSLYELSGTGWKAHTQGADTARAFIFNNPFFRKQLNTYARFGMPSMSLGVTILVRKDKVEILQLILENLTAENNVRKEKFSLILNNCNQGIMRVLTQAGIEGFDHRGYVHFSTVLSFRELLLRPQHPVEGLRIYPLPNTPIEEAVLRAWIPNALYRSHGIKREMRRSLPVFPRDYIYVKWTRLSNFIRRLGGRHADA